MPWREPARAIATGLLVAFIRWLVKEVYDYGKRQRFNRQDETGSD